MTAALALLIGVLAFGMVVRAPVGFSMLAAGIAYLAFKKQDMGLAAEQVGNGLYNSYVLLAVPLFILAANLMNAGTISERIFDFCRILVGRLRGGLAQVDILVSVVFSGMSGSAIADAAGPGLVTIKQMLKKPGYTPGFAGAVVVASATIGPIIPPSIPMVIYALVSGTSVGALFLGGVIPGLLMAGVLMIAVHIIATRRNMPKDDPVPRADVAADPAARRAAAVAADRAARRPVQRRLHAHRGGGGGGAARAAAGRRGLSRIEPAHAVGGARRIDALVGGDHDHHRRRVPAQLCLHVGRRAAGAGAVGRRHAARATGSSCCSSTLVFLVLGCFLDTAVMLLVFVPMLLPAAKLLGIDLVHFGVVVVINMMIGLVTPPFGMLLFVTNALTGIPIKDMLREGWLFLVMLLLLLLLLTLVPQIVLWLPQTMGYGLK